MTTLPKYQKALFLAGLLGLFFTYSATAQRVDKAERLYPYTGVYVLPSGVQLAVSVHGDNLAVHPRGEATSITEVDNLNALAQRADAILAGLAKNDTAPLRTALPARLRDRATDLERLFTLFTQGHGALKSYQVMGTVAHSANRAWTLVHVTFEKGSEVIRLSWKDDQLTTIQRGAHPKPIFQHVASARFESASGDDTITFNLRADGAVESMTVAGPYGAVTAYKLDDVTALQ